MIQLIIFFNIFFLSPQRIYQNDAILRLKFFFTASPEDDDAKMHHFYAYESRAKCGVSAVKA